MFNEPLKKNSRANVSLMVRCRLTLVDFNLGPEVGPVKNERLWIRWMPNLVLITLLSELNITQELGSIATDARTGHA